MIIKYPVLDHTISQPFGFDNTNHPERSKFYELFNNKHPGVDFPVAVGTEIYAAFPGIVVREEFHVGMGNVVSIRNGNILALYAHLSEFRINLGALVTEGQLIGISGETGAACVDPHLHFELRDLSKVGLANMVFEPLFTEPAKNYIQSFYYKVKNANTKKSLRFLAVLYFGNEKYWEKIRNENNLKLSADEILLDGVPVLIPNYE